MHDVHLVTTGDPPSALTAALCRLGMSRVEVAGTHPALPSRSLFSAYTPSAPGAKALCDAVVAVAQEFDDVGILVERERVSVEMPFRVPEALELPLSPEATFAWMGDFGSSRSRVKRADIHLSLPASALDGTLATAIERAGLTYIDVVRSGNEDMLGIRPQPGELWRAYTVQFDGPAALHAARRAYNAFEAFSSRDGHVQLGTLKLEVAAEVWLNDRHPGIPAVVAGA
jgi:hypothetical protein